MRILLIVCAVMAATSRYSFALKPASQGEIDAIEAQLIVAQALDIEIKAARQKVLEAKSDVETTEARLLELNKALDNEKAKQLAARTKAIHMTILAYGIAPANLRGTSVMRWTKDRPITWLPVAGEGENRLIQNAGGKLKPSNKPLEPFSGITYPDGVTYIPESTFNSGVGFLASILFHERTHFEQYTTDGMGNVMSRPEREVNAYEIGLDNAHIFFDPVKEKASIDEIRVLLRAKQAQVRQEKGLWGRIRRYFPSDNQPDRNELTVHTNVELADISGLVAQARGQADIARREREEREARARAAAEEAARREHDERLKRTYADMAIRSCANPGSVTQAELDSLPVPYQENSQMSSPMPQGLDECAFRVYLNLDRGVDAERVRRMSTTPAAARPVPRSAGPAPARGIATTFFQSMLPTIRAYAESSCRSPGAAPVPANVKLPLENIVFLEDSREIERLSAGLGQCEQRLFLRLIEVIRLGQGQSVTSDWVARTAKSYIPVHVAPPPRSSEPQGCIPGDNSRRNCIACGNKYCG